MKTSVLKPQNSAPSFVAHENKVVFVNGIFSAELSRVGRLPAGVSLETREGFSLRIPDKVVLEDLLRVVFVSEKGAPSREEFPLKIMAGASTRLNLVLHKAGKEALLPKKIRAEFFLGENACIDCYQIEESGLKGDFITENFFHLKKHAVVEYLAFAAADGASSTRTIAELEEPHGFFSAKGLSMLRGKARADHTLVVNHRAGQCISRQYYKTVLAGSSKASFDSLVHVHPNASKSDSRQLNRNLILSDSAEARSKPDLRIDNDDVAASHGSATGQLEENEIFYLQSRGLNEEMARLVIVDGFAEEITEGIHEKHLKAHLEEIIHRGIRALVDGEKS